MKKKPDYKWAAKELAKMADEEKDPHLKMIFGRAAAIGREKASAGSSSDGKVCADCGGHGWVENFTTMSIDGYCKTCGGSGRIKKTN